LGITIGCLLGMVPLWFYDDVGESRQSGSAAASLATTTTSDAANDGAQLPKQ